MSDRAEVTESEFLADVRARAAKIKSPSRANYERRWLLDIVYRQAFELSKIKSTLNVAYTAIGDYFRADPENPDALEAIDMRLSDVLGQLERIG